MNISAGTHAERGVDVAMVNPVPSNPSEIASEPVSGKTNVAQRFEMTVQLDRQREFDLDDQTKPYRKIAFSQANPTVCRTHGTDAVFKFRLRIPPYIQPPSDQERNNAKKRFAITTASGC